MSLRNGVVRHPIISLLLISLLGIGLLAWQHRVALQAFPGIISAYTAKEYCSCRYVMNNPESYCRGYVQQYVSSTLVDDPLRKRVIATGLGRSASAVWSGARQGCRLNP